MHVTRYVLATPHVPTLNSVRNVWRENRTEKRSPVYCLHEIIIIIIIATNSIWISNFASVSVCVCEKESLCDLRSPANAVHIRIEHTLHLIDWTCTMNFFKKLLSFSLQNNKSPASRNAVDEPNGSLGVYFGMNMSRTIFLFSRRDEVHREMR